VEINRNSRVTNIKYHAYYLLIMNVLGHDVLELDSSIFVIENIMSPEKCSEYIKLIDSLSLTKMEVSAELKNNVECYAIHFDELVASDAATYKKYDDEVFSITHKAFEIVKAIRPQIMISNDSGYMFRKIYGETVPHIDNLITNVTCDNTVNVNAIRSLSLIIVLNDDYSGGIFSFPYQKIKHKLQKGSAIVFPPYWTHLHSVSKVEENKFRYTINTWALGN